MIILQKITWTWDLCFPKQKYQYLIFDFLSTLQCPIQNSSTKTGTSTKAKSNMEVLKTTINKKSKRCKKCQERRALTTLANATVISKAQVFKTKPPSLSFLAAKWAALLCAGAQQVSGVWGFGTDTLYIIVIIVRGNLTISLQKKNCWCSQALEAAA